MMVFVRLRDSGAEKMALGREKDLYSWDFDLSITPFTGNFGTQFDVPLGTAEEQRKVATEALEERIKEVRAESYLEEMALKERLNNLLSLGYSPATEVLK